MTPKHRPPEPDFSQDWFSYNVENWQHWTAPFRGQPINAMEVGCFEGRASLWLLEKVLFHDDARLTVIDTFAGDIPTADGGLLDMSAVEARFDHNTKPHKAKVRKMTQASPDALRSLAGETFTFAYIDGSHRAADVLSDAVMVWPMIEPGGVLVFDDYLWNLAPDELGRPRIAIDAFMVVHRDQFKILNHGYQVALQKCPA